MSDTDTELPLVLIVDDFQDNREMFAEFLSFSGFRVAEASDGNEAVEQALALLPDVVLMDLSLPGLDGWEATRQIRKDPRAGRMKILALSGHALSGHTKEALEAGCDGFITKPCLPENLVSEIRRVLAARA